MTKDMTVGSPMKLVLNFAIPLMFGNLFQQFYSMVDTIIVGRFFGNGSSGRSGLHRFGELFDCRVLRGRVLRVRHSRGPKLRLQGL